MLVGTHDFSLVALSILIATIASYTALDLAGRMRAATGGQRHAWLATAAVAMGGGVWAMHFIAMLAFTLPGMEISYDPLLTLVSLILPILVTAAGFAVIERGGAGSAALLCGGLIMGLGIVAMHYTGMAAMRMGASIGYDWAWVATSVVIALVAATVALWLASRNADAKLKLVAALAMGLAVSGMHYAAMHGVMFHIIHPVAGADAGASAVDQKNLALEVAGITLAILLLALIAATFDRRFAELTGVKAEALRRSEERYRLLLQSVTDYAIYMLDPNGKVANWNWGAERIKGYAAGEIIGEPFSRFYSEDDRAADRPREALRMAVLDGRFEDEGWRVRKNGSRFWASVVIDPIKNSEGEVIGFANVTRDITERKRAQEALQDAHRALAQSQKMEALGQLTGGVAHDFNNLLAIVMGSMELLQKRLPDDPRLRRLVDNAHQAARRGADLTQRMLAFARRQDLKPCAVDVPELVRAAAVLYERAVGAEARIETRFAPDLPRACVDPNQLELALLNLVLNARDALPDGGTVTIAARFEGQSGSSSGYVRIAVSDDGVGMDEETLQRAREPFFSTKAVGKGAGLGLSMVHGLAEQSNGRLELKSMPGRGTTDEIWLPVAEQPAGDIAAPAAHRAREPLVVMAVDDDAMVLQNTAAILEDLGHSVISAGSGEIGLDLLRATMSVDLIVTDLTMPGMTGLELIRRVRSERPEVGVLLVTGYADIPDDAADGLTKLHKPFSQQALAEALASALQAKAANDAAASFQSRHA